MSDKKDLYTELRHYIGQKLYPLHMPGHKRRLAPASVLPYEIDFTEVPGTDDLHAADGILRRAMDRTAALYGADRTWYLVNGSTCGNLAAIFAATRQGGEIIAARNCHRSVLHALELRGLHVHWALPSYDAAFELCGCIRPETIEKLLTRYPKTEAVVLTSPTYEGIVSDIPGIARLCHAQGIPLIVDEAHGAHLGLEGHCREEESAIAEDANVGGPSFRLPARNRPFFPDSAIRQGADLVIQSPHKTLPSLTQTAWLHLKGKLISENRVERMLGIFETSSPSYPLMVSLDSCTSFLRGAGEDEFRQWGERLQCFIRGTEKLHCIRLYREDPASAYDYDRSKLLLHSLIPDISGKMIQNMLREKYHYELEMSLGRNVLAMTSMADSDEALEGFLAAITEIDERLWTLTAERDWLTEWQTLAVQKQQSVDNIFTEVEETMTLQEAVEAAHEDIGLAVAEGRIAGEYIYCYPPGIPLVVPGERLRKETLQLLQALQENGDRLHCTESGENLDRITVCRV